MTLERRELLGGMYAYTLGTSAHGVRLTLVAAPPRCVPLRDALYRCYRRPCENIHLLQYHRTLSSCYGANCPGGLRFKGRGKRYHLAPRRLHQLDAEKLLVAHAYGPGLLRDRDDGYSLFPV